MGLRAWFRSERHRSAVKILLALNVLMIFVSGVEATPEPYRLDTGDVLQISVFGETNYPLELTVDDAGLISLPLLGDIQVRDKTTSVVRSEVENFFRDKDLIINPFVQVVIKAYRPFFIAGAVSDAGSYQYQPSMTVRHAIAIAGGFRALEAAGQAPALTIADLRGEQDALGIEIFRQEVKLARLRAELSPGSPFVVPSAPEINIDPELIAQIVGSEQDQIQARGANFATDIAHVEQSLARARKETATLQQAHLDRLEADQFQHQELETARALRDQGLTRKSVVLSAERENSLNREQLGYLEIQQAEAEQKVSDLERQLERRKEDQRLEILTDMQNTQIDLGKAQNGLKYLTDKLIFISLYGEHRSLDQLGDSVRISIHRRLPGQENVQQIAGNQNTPIRAGDVIDIVVVPNSEFVPNVQ